MKSQRSFTCSSDFQGRNDIVEIDWSLLSPEEIRKMSVVEIKSTTIYDSNTLPRDHSINDRRQGTVDRRYTCDFCQHKVETCDGHNGHMELSAAVYHVGYIKTNLKILKSTCYFCSRVVLPEVYFESSNAVMIQNKECVEPTKVSVPLPQEQEKQKPKTYLTDVVEKDASSSTAAGIFNGKELSEELTEESKILRELEDDDGELLVNTIDDQGDQKDENEIEDLQEVQDAPFAEAEDKEVDSGDQDADGNGNGEIIDNEAEELLKEIDGNDDAVGEDIVADESFDDPDEDVLVDEVNEDDDSGTKKSKGRKKGKKNKSEKRKKKRKQRTLTKRKRPIKLVKEIMGRHKSIFINFNEFIMD